MTTKQQELEALAKVRKIVDSLGDLSYTGTALRGAFDLAEQNIEMDAAFSVQEYIDIANQAQSVDQSLRAELAKAKADNDTLAAKLEQESKRYTAEREYSASRNCELIECKTKLDEANHRIADLEQAIIKLKVRLFDMMEKVAS